VNAVLAWFSDAWASYQRLLSWERPVESALALGLWSWATLALDAEYAPATPAFLLVVHLARQYLRRRAGALSRFWLLQAPLTAGAFSLHPGGAAQDAAEALEIARASASDHLGRSQSTTTASSASSSSSLAAGAASFTPLAELRVAVLRGRSLGDRRVRTRVAPGAQRVTAVESSGASERHEEAQVEERGPAVPPARYYVRVSYLPAGERAPSAIHEAEQV